MIYDLVFLYNDEDILCDLFEEVSEFGSERISNEVYKITCDYEQYMYCMDLYNLHGFEKSYGQYLGEVILKKNPCAYINIPEHIAIEVVKNNPQAIRWIKNQTVDIQISAVESWTAAIHDIADPYAETLLLYHEKINKHHDDDDEDDELI